MWRRIDAIDALGRVAAAYAIAPTFAHCHDIADVITTALHLHDTQALGIVGLLFVALRPPRSSSDERRSTRVLSVAARLAFEWRNVGPSFPALDASAQGQGMQELLTVSEAARWAKCSESFLNKARLTGTGPRFVKVGRSVRYRQADLEAWAEASLSERETERGPPC